jgi:hypothetical protein
LFFFQAKENHGNKQEPLDKKRFVETKTKKFLVLKNDGQEYLQQSKKCKRNTKKKQEENLKF